MRFLTRVIYEKTRYTSAQFGSRTNKYTMVAQSKNSNIKLLMQKHDLTIEMLAQEMQLSVSTINRLLMGSRSDPKFSTVQSLARFFDVSVDALMGERPINLRPGQDLDGFDTKYTLVQVPIIHWEQVKEADTRVPKLTFEIWNHWTAITEEVGENSYALIIKQSSLPPPFYFKTIIVVDIKRSPRDSDYVLVMNKENPILCRFILNGIEKLYQSIHLKQTLKEDEVKLCGTVVQWTIPYYEKAVL